jgi:crotonobetainyl-CoA:carnitine CoA-transferase CaiB-like acyl-CoA transferase
VTSRSSALGSLKVLDLSRVRAGPACCRVLADFGADVIKIEAPLGVDPSAGVSGARHGYDMLNLHRNKRSLTLNLKEPEGHALFMRMVEGADVVVENFRPNVKDRLGIGYDDLAAVNPRIILASISGFGQDGPYAKRAGFDQIAQGLGGLMGVTGIPEEGPMRAGTAVADLSSGLFAAIGILVAVQERAQSGQGQWVQSSLLESQISLMDFQAARYLIDGEVPQSSGNEHPYVTPMGVVATKDGHMNLGVGSDAQWRAFCVLIGHSDWGTNVDYATNPARFERRDELWVRLKPIFAQKTTAEWVKTLEGAGVPAGPIYMMDEVFADPQVQHLGMATPIYHPVRGETKLVAQPVKLSRTPASIYVSAPDAGEHSDAILTEVGLSLDEIAALRDRNVI